MNLRPSNLHRGLSAHPAAARRSPNKPCACSTSPKRRPDLFTYVTLVSLLLLGFLQPPVPVSARVLPGVTRLVDLAKPFANNLTRHGGVSVKDRLAVMTMSTHAVNLQQLAADPDPGPGLRARSMYKCLTLLLKHIGTYTPLDVYIWVREGIAPPDPVVHPFNNISSNIAVMPILADHWHRRYRESYLSDQNLDFNDYRVMGQWRLDVQYTFTALLGYDYLLQIDDDSYVMGPHPQNLIEQLRAKNALMAGHNVFYDASLLFAGLPELARSFIVERIGEFAHIYNGLPADKRFKEPTRLYKHCNPPNISGLQTRPTNSNIGYDNAYVHGNFLFLKMDLWMQPHVQDFVQLCLLSGGTYRHRWNEQSVLAFVWNMFVPEEEGRDQFLLLDKLPFKHGRPFLTKEEWQAAMDQTPQSPHVASG